MSDEGVADIVKKAKNRAKAAARDAEKARAESAAESAIEEDPFTPGRPVEGVPHGQWMADPATGLPPNCPVQALGMEGDVIHLVDGLGQHAPVSPNSFGQNFAQRLFLQHAQLYLPWAWPRYNKNGDVDGFDTTKLRADMYAAAARRGLWDSVENIRGLGAWTDERGRLIWHAGDRLWIEGKEYGLGSFGKYFYPRRPDGIRPWPEEITHDDNPALTLLKALRAWNWERPKVDPVLMLGWIGTAFLGGALPWRASVFLTGDKGIGKTTLQTLVATILGRQVVATPDTTAAGIYQKVKQDAVAVAIDELEASADNRRIMQVVQLARLAASGGVMLRGGSDHTGVAFQARSPFLFGAINPPPLKPQDRSRMALLSIGKLKPELIAAAPILKDVETMGPRLLRQLLDGWEDFPKLRAWYGDALREGGHDARGMDTYGTLLTCAHMMLGDEGVEAAGFSIEFADWWGSSDALKLDDDGGDDNWRKCVNHLLGVPIEAWRSGKMPTIGRLLEELTDSHNPLLLSDAQGMLASAGCGLLERGKICAGPALAIPHQSPILNKLFAGTEWGEGVWQYALKQEQERAVVIQKPTTNRARINGAQMRCTMVDVLRLLALE